MSSEIPAEEKEALINERIEKIRQRNEEIQRRHREVLEDKKNADAISELAISLDSAKPKHPPFVKKSVDKPPRERAQRTRPFLHQPSMRQDTEQRTGNASKMYSNFADGDGPPPDPRYSFLADDERDEQRTEVKNDPSKSVKISKKGREGNNTGPHSKVRSNPRKKPSSHGRNSNWNTPVQKNSKEEKWRAERAAIDAERINRQKTQEGNWRREWDVEKTGNDLEDDSSLRSPRGYQPSYRSKTRSEGGSLSWRNNRSNEAQERQSDSYPHTMIFNRNRERPVFFKSPQFRDDGEQGAMLSADTSRRVMLNGENVQVRIPPGTTSDLQSLRSSSTYPDSPVSSKYSSFSEDDHGEESWEDVSEDEKPMYSEYGKPRLPKDMQSKPPIVTQKYHVEPPVRSLHRETKMKLSQKLSNENSSGIFEDESQNPDIDDTKDF